MERYGWNGEGKYLSTPSVVEILNCDNLAINRFISGHVLRPKQSSNGFRYWEPEDVFKGFLVIRITQKFKDEFGKRRRIVMNQQVLGDLTNILRSPKKTEVLESDEWREVTQRASELGFSFEGTGFDYRETKKS